MKKIINIILVILISSSLLAGKKKRSYNFDVGILVEGGISFKTHFNIQQYYNLGSNLVATGISSLNGININILNYFVYNFSFPIRFQFYITNLFGEIDFEFDNNSYIQKYFTLPGEIITISDYYKSLGFPFKHIIGGFRWSDNTGSNVSFIYFGVGKKSFLSGSDVSRFQYALIGIRNKRLLQKFLPVSGFYMIDANLWAFPIFPDWLKNNEKIQNFMNKIPNPIQYYSYDGSNDIPGLFWIIGSEYNFSIGVKLRRIGAFLKFTYTGSFFVPLFADDFSTISEIASNINQTLYYTEIIQKFTLTTGIDFSLRELKTHIK